METCCQCCYLGEYIQHPDPRNTYQQFRTERHSYHSGEFQALSVAADGIPPILIRRKGWKIVAKPPKYFQLDEALGVNETLRAQLPTLDFSLDTKNSEPVLVGQWYCPFIFIKEGKLKDQMKRSMYYEMTLEQRWEQIFEKENDYEQGNIFNVNLEVKTETVLLGGKEANWNEKNKVNDVIWFKSSSELGEQSIGLSSLIIERMKWELMRFGWVEGENRHAKVDYTSDKCTVGDVWSRFGCYVLVERFNLKRMDGSVALTYDFKHTQQLRGKWK